MKAEKKEWIKPVAIVSVIGLLLVGSIAGALMWMTRSPSKPASQSPVDIAKFIASDGFDRLPLAKKEEYLSQMPQGQEARSAFEGLDQDSRRKFFENSREVRETQMNKKVKEYFLQPTKEQRAKWLDDYIAAEDKRMEEMMKSRQQGDGRQRANAGGQQGQRPQAQGQGSDQGQRRGQQGGADRSVRMKQRLESTPPELRAMRMQFMADVAARRAETGKARPQGAWGGGNRGR